MSGGPRLAKALQRPVGQRGRPKQVHCARCGQKLRRVPALAAVPTDEVCGEQAAERGDWEQAEHERAVCAIFRQAVHDWFMEGSVQCS